MRLEMRSKVRYPSGFTLIEVMIVVAIVAILAAIAYPSYSESVAKGRRAQVTTQMLAAQQFMERWYSENYDYSKNTAGILVTAANQFPARFAKVPAEGTQYYTMSFDAIAANAYTLQAVPLPGGAMVNDKCGTFKLDHNGKKSISTTGTGDVESCWR
jgi:type IV pilus assembly protein PilE